MNNTGMATRHNVLIVNADTTKGYAIAHELLIGRFRESFGQVWCAVKNASRSGMLFEMGGRVVQLTGESSRDEIMMYMKHVDTLVLVPNPACNTMVEEMQHLVEAAKNANVKRCLLVSVLGADDREVQFAQELKRIEDYLSKAIDNHCIIRHGFLQNWMLMWSWPVQTEQKLLMPLKKDAEFAPLNVHDLTLFIGYMVSERGHRQTEKMYKLTGEDMTSGHGLVETCNKTLGTKIEYQEIDMQKAEEYMRKVLQDNHWARRAIDVCRLINNGKMDSISHDETKVIGEQPMTLDRFLRDNQIRFKRV